MAFTITITNNETGKVQVHEEHAKAFLVAYTGADGNTQTLFGCKGKSKDLAAAYAGFIHVQDLVRKREPDIAKIGEIVNLMYKLKQEEANE